MKEHADLLTEHADISPLLFRNRPEQGKNMGHQHAGPQRERLNKQGTRRLWDPDPVASRSGSLYGDGLMRGGGVVAARFYSAWFQAGLGRSLVKVLGSGRVGSQIGTIGGSSHREPSVKPLVPSHMLLLACFSV